MIPEASGRPFPFTCHAVKKPLQPFWIFWCCVITAVVFAVIALDAPQGEPRWRLYFLHFVGIVLLLLVLIPMRSGFREVLPNRVWVFGGSTWVTPRILPFELIIPGCAGALLVSAGVVLTRIFGGVNAIMEAGINWTLMGPGGVVLGGFWILSLIWQQLRGMRLTPEGISYWRGIGKISLAWDDLGDAASANDVRDHEAARRYWEWYLPGAKIVVPVESVMGVLLRVHWEDVNTPRLLLETDHFQVEPSALLTAILALRDHPELRPLLGTRESKALFAGPPWRVRRHLYRTQQWWPAGTAPEGIAVDSDGVVKEFQ